MSSTKVIAFRVQKADLYYQEEENKRSIAEGVIVCLSFLKEATIEKAQKAAEKLAGYKILSKPFFNPECQVMIIPQACLAGKAKGKSIQYHSQVNKEEGVRIYQAFCDALKAQLGSDKVVAGIYDHTQSLKYESGAIHMHHFEF
eukprot:GCRY01000898.1.p1 GENE.GCRY01000898.1~~GCRY01000898.1.p1  ORF type:complete len:166 (+),score=22.70 GCRY01000898.1:69-500(+)